MLGLHANSRNRETVPVSLRPVSNINEVGYIFPPCPSWPSTRCSLQYRYLQTFATITHNQTRQWAQSESNCYGPRQNKTNSAIIGVSFLSWTFSVSKNIVENISNKWKNNLVCFKRSKLISKGQVCGFQGCWQ